MEAFDTNVVVRLIVRGDEAQCRQAERTFRAAIEAGGAWIASVVLVEAWYFGSAIANSTGLAGTGSRSAANFGLPRQEH